MYAHAVTVIDNRCSWRGGFLPATFHPFGRLVLYGGVQHTASTVCLKTAQKPAANKTCPSRSYTSQPPVAADHKRYSPLIGFKRVLARTRLCNRVIYLFCHAASWQQLVLHGLIPSPSSTLPQIKAMRFPARAVAEGLPKLPEKERRNEKRKGERKDIHSHGPQRVLVGSSAKLWLECGCVNRGNCSEETYDSSHP